MGKDLMVGFRAVNLAPVTTHTTAAYATEQAISLPWAGKMALTPKETSQDMYYDDTLYLAYKDLKGYDAELRFAQIDFATLELLGLGTYDETTNTFNETMSVTGGEYALSFIADNPDHLPFYIKFRSFKITEIRPDSYTTTGDTMTANEMIMTGSIGALLTTGLAYKSEMKLLPDKSNQDACIAFLTEAESFPA